MPEAVLEQAAADMLDWHGCGMGVMEMSHRGREFGEILTQAQADLRELLAIPETFEVLFMQGGALAENAIVPLNLSRAGVVDFVVTGGWSQKSHQEAQRYANAHLAASSQAQGYTCIPDPATWQLSANAAYVHLCSNETIHGVEFQQLPDLQALGSAAPLVIDFSSHVASRSLDWSRVGLAFGGAQKNLGPAGLTLVVVRRDLLDRALPACPTAFRYQTVAANASMYNTPPTFAIYVAGLVFQWLKRQGGMAAIEAANIEKARLLYTAIDESGGFYANRVDPACRSRMNVPFFIHDAALHDVFVAQAREAGLLQLKGHKSVGGLRASLYNAMPLAGVQALVDFMHQFQTRHG